MSIDICRVSVNNNIVCFSRKNRNETFVSQSTSTIRKKEVASRQKKTLKRMSFNAVKKLLTSVTVILMKLT